MSSPAAARAVRPPGGGGGAALRWPLVVVAVAATFLPALDGEILSWDDGYYLSDSTIELTTRWPERIIRVFSSFYFSNYNPLHRLGYWVQLGLWGREPFCFHLVSLIFHAANTLLVLALARRLGWREGPAFVAALLFAVHPSRVEVVAWISAQKDLGATFFVLVALVLYAPVLAGGATRAWGRLLAVGVFFALALLYKSMAVTFPLLLLVLDLAWRRPPGRALLEKVPFFAISGIFALLTLDAAPRVAPLGGGWDAHVATIVKAPWIYLLRVVWPAGYSARYWVERETGLFCVAALASVGFVCLLGAGLCLCFRGRLRRPALLLVAWPAACMLPVLNLIPIPIVVAERYLYLALLGPCLVIASWWGAVCRESPLRSPPHSRLLSAAGLMVVVVLAFLSQRRCGAFHDTETLWRTSLQFQPNNPAVRLYLARQLMTEPSDRVRLLESLDLLDVSAPGARENQNYCTARAQVLRKLGRGEDADAELRRALDLARRQGLRLSTAAAEARRLANQGSYKEAHEVLNRCRPVARTEERRLASLRAQICVQAGDDREYLRWNTYLLERSPFDVLLWHNREHVTRRLGMEAESARAARRCDELLGERGAAPGDVRGR